MPRSSVLTPCAVCACGWLPLCVPPAQVTTELKPQDNSLLEGLYKSGGNYCTQVRAVQQQQQWQQQGPCAPAALAGKRVNAGADCVPCVSPPLCCCCCCCCCLAAGTCSVRLRASGASPTSWTALVSSSSTPLCVIRVRAFDHRAGLLKMPAGCSRGRAAQQPPHHTTTLCCTHTHTRPANAPHRRDGALHYAH
jgi:hypothetical protein